MQILNNFNKFQLFQYVSLSILKKGIYQNALQSILTMKNIPKPSQFLQENEEDTYFKMKELLHKGLYSIQPTFRQVTKFHMALLSTPGVADVCQKIKDDLSQINGLTIRGKSIAIVSRGQMLHVNGQQFLPIMDWFITQIKFYSNVDCYPFVIRPGCSLAHVLSDLANSFSGVLFLDHEKIPEIQTSVNFFVLSHPKICKLKGCQITDAQTSAYVLSKLIKNQFNGIPKKQDIIKLLSTEPSSLKMLQLNYQEYTEAKIKNFSAIKLHETLKGKIGIDLKISSFQQIKPYFTLKNLKKLVCQKEKQPSITSKLNAILTDGTSILGLGNIGPAPGLPVMQVKSMMFKLLGNVNVVPISINPRKTPLQAVQAILDLIHLYKAVNLQDFKAPQCFTVERELQSRNKLTVFHDDQHGTSIATLAAFINATKLASKQINQCKVVVNGAGAAGINIATILHQYGVKKINVCDTHGTIFKGRQTNMNIFKQQIAQFTNLDQIKGTLQDVIVDADVFIGVSTRNVFKKQWIKLMNSSPIIFALANPIPQISQQDAIEGGCFIYGSGKNNKPNQISNSLVYPGIFRAINEHNIKKITYQMKIQAAEELAMITGKNATTEQILPTSLNRNISIRISQRLKQCL